MFDNEGEESVERPEYAAAEVRLMNLAPGNLDHAEGEEIVIITIARGADIEPLVFSMDDAKLMAAKLLVAMATNGDEFAQKLLDDNFPADDDGFFIWPEPEFESD